MRPATKELKILCNEDWYEEEQNSALMTANTPALGLTKEGRKNTMYILQTIGTNGDYNVKLEIKNKNDLIGDYIKGNVAVIYPTTERYWLGIPQTIEEGDYLKIYATAAVATGTTYTKFDLRGIKNEHLEARAPMAAPVTPTPY